MNGIVREYTLPRLDLHDGGNYTIKLIVCNGAKICVEDESRGIIVDSSPPTPGELNTFKFFVLSYYVSLRFEFHVVMSVTISA